MRTLMVVTWFCSEFFDFLLALSFTASLSSPAAVILYAPVHACTCVHVLDACTCVLCYGRGVLQREGTCEVGRQWLCWGEVG